MFEVFQPKCWTTPALSISAQKWCLFDFLQYISAPTPLSKANEGLQYVDLMACRDFYCEETKPI